MEKLTRVNFTETHLHICPWPMGQTAYKRHYVKRRKQILSFEFPLLTSYNKSWCYYQVWPLLGF